MRSIQFESKKSDIYQDVTESDCISLSVILKDLIISRSNIVTEIKMMSNVPKNYDMYRDQIERMLRMYSKRGSPNEIEFVEGLSAMYISYENNSDNWIHALTLTVEFTFLELVREKYKNEEIDIVHESIFHAIGDSNNDITTKPKPVDVIAWCHTNLSGEFIEVKKNLESYSKMIKSGDDIEKFKSKAETLFNFLDDLESDRPTSNYIVGFGTLSSSPTAERLMASIFIELGLLKENQGFTDLSPSLYIINGDNLYIWYGSKVI